MSGAKSKNKGKGFEREVCNYTKRDYEDNFNVPTVAHLLVVLPPT